MLLNCFAQIKNNITFALRKNCEAGEARLQFGLVCKIRQIGDEEEFFVFCQPRKSFFKGLSAAAQVGMILDV